jgi:glycerate 2-kinase
VIARDVCEDVFRAAVAACDPAPAVRAAVARLVPLERAVIGLAVGKAALAMARGAGPVARGLVVAPQLDGGLLPIGWSARDAAHPLPDERSVAAGAAALELMQSAEPDELVLALISGGASSLIEQPTVPLAVYRAHVAEVMASGVPIARLNEVRTSLSNLKGGKLAAASRAPVVTLAVSDVIGDDLHIIGSGPTYPCSSSEVIMPMRAFFDAACAELERQRIVLVAQEEPLRGPIELLAPVLERGIYWGEPTVALPAGHGTGGRAQQLALALAAQIAGTDHSAFVVGSDGIDGPAPAGRLAPAGAYVDGATWAAIGDAAATRALERRDAGTVLAAVGALVISGPTGINHADLVIIG